MRTELLLQCILLINLSKEPVRQNRDCLVNYIEQKRGVTEVKPGWAQIDIYGIKNGCMVSNPKHFKHSRSTGISSLLKKTVSGANFYKTSIFLI